MQRIRNICLSYFKRDDGVAAVEFAMISGIFMAFVMGIYAVGIYFFTWNRLQYGTETAARYVAIHDDATPTEIEEIILESLSLASANPDSLEVTVDSSVSNGINFSEVSSTYQFSWNFPFVPASFNEMVLTATSRTAVN